MAVLVMAFAFIGLPSAASTEEKPSAASIEEKDTRVQNPLPSDCGDLEDPSNIQHLSHHPSRYQECLRQIDPVKFKEATGDDISDYLR